MVNDFVFVVVRLTTLADELTSEAVQRIDRRERERGSAASVRVTSARAHVAASSMREKHHQIVATSFHRGNASARVDPPAAEQSRVSYSYVPAIDAFRR